MSTTVETYKDAIRTAFPDAVFAEELGKKDPIAKKGQEIGDTFTLIVDKLRKHSDQRLALLGRNIWDVVHYRHVHTLMHSQVRTMTFIALAKKGRKDPIGAIWIPPNWLDLLKREPLMGVGAVIFNGSQAVDFYNDRLPQDTTELIASRALAYEAHYLRGFRGFPMNEYQKRALRLYPDGFDVVFAYDHRPVAPSVS